MKMLANQSTRNKDSKPQLASLNRLNLNCPMDIITQVSGKKTTPKKQAQKSGLPMGVKPEESREDGAHNKASEKPLDYAVAAQTMECGKDWAFAYETFGGLR